MFGTRFRDSVCTHALGTFSPKISSPSGMLSNIRCDVRIRQQHRTMSKTLLQLFFRMGPKKSTDIRVGEAVLAGWLVGWLVYSYTDPPFGMQGSLQA